MRNQVAYPYKTIDKIIVLYIVVHNCFFNFRLLSSDATLHNEELCTFYSTCNIVRVIKLKMRWMGHAVYMGKSEMHTEFW